MRTEATRSTRSTDNAAHTESSRSGDPLLALHQAVESAPPPISRLDALERILEALYTQRLELGSKTSESELARQLGFETRTPIVREALALLARDGIVEARPKAGYWFQSVSAEQAEEILKVRASAEIVVAREAASPRGPVRPPDLDSLGEFVDEMQGDIDCLDQLARAFSQNRQGRGPLIIFQEQGAGALPHAWKWSTLQQLRNMYHEFPTIAVGNTLSFLRSDERFRTELAGVTGYLSAMEAIRRWTDRLRVFRVDHLLSFEEMVGMVAGHRALLQAIRDRNVPAAIAAIEQQLNYTQRRVMATPPSAPSRARRESDVGRALPKQLALDAGVAALVPFPLFVRDPRPLATLGLDVRCVECCRRLFSGNTQVWQEVAEETGSILKWDSHLSAPSGGSGKIDIVIRSEAVLDTSHIASLRVTTSAPLSKALQSAGKTLLTHASLVAV